MNKFLFVLAGFILAHSSFAAADARPGVEGSRVSVAKEMTWVGKIFRNGQFFCTAWILDHGLAITAKHCFQHSGLDQSAVTKNVASYSLVFGTSENLASVPGVSEVKFDSGENDIVLVKYQADLTSQKIALPAHEIFRGKIPADTAVTVVGFPGPTFKRVASIGCRTTGKTGRFGPTPADSGYEGVFEDTTCGAWYGVSGGVVFHQNEDGGIVLYGVLTHTFDVLSDGSINYSYVQTDQFGQHTTGMFSAFGTSFDLQ